jgi:hypothetical protein
MRSSSTFSRMMPQKKIHIVAFDIPWPADYGGVIDIFYKIKALHALGYAISLHCFEYGRKHQDTLLTYCSNVFYYPRKMHKGLLLHHLPFIVVSRQSDELLNRIVNDDAPIIFEGMHCSYYANEVDLSKKKKILRLHNIEHDYYHALAKQEINPFKKIYFGLEAEKLRRYESTLSAVDHVACISSGDCEALKPVFAHACYIPPFHPFEKIQIQKGLGNYCLYHGNLSVAENYQAALFLIKEVFNDLNYSLIIAGNKPPNSLIKAAAYLPNVKIMSQVDDTTMQQLIANAQINILPTFQATGIKLKLLYALYNGRHCMVSNEMVYNTGLESLCHVVKDPDEYKAGIINLMATPFQELDVRSHLLHQHFNNLENAKRLTEIF